MKLVDNPGEALIVMPYRSLLASRLIFEFLMSVSDFVTRPMCIRALEVFSIRSISPLEVSDQ